MYSSRLELAWTTSSPTARVLCRDIGHCASMTPCKGTSRALPAALYKTQRPSPSLLYQEEASAARNGIQERHGRRYRRPSVARKPVGSANAATSARWGTRGKCRMPLRIALGVILAEGF
jgi:hypothetical protein